MANIVYEVVAEFTIQSAAATIATNALTKKVQQLSDTVDNAVFGAARLGFAYAKSFLTGGGGILGILGGAIQSSEKFRATQIELASTMVSNGFIINGEVAKFNDALLVSDGILKDINEKAAKFGISPGALSEGTKVFAAALGPKGLAGNNLSNAVELSRVVQKGAPALGVDRNQAIQGSFNALFGQLAKNSEFARIFVESGDVIKKTSKGAITDVASFNKATAKLRLKVLIAGLDKLAGSSDVVAARAQTLTARLGVIRDLFVGVGSILKPIGDQLRRIIGPILDEFANQIKTKGKMIVTLITNFMKRIGDSPKELLLNIRQFANLSGDIQKAGDSFRRLVGIVLIANVIGNMIPASLIAKGGAIGLLAKGIQAFGLAIGGILGKLTLGAGFKAFFVSLSKFMFRLLPLFGAFIIVFQIFSKALDKAKIKFMQAIDVFGGEFIKTFDKLLSVIDVIMEPFNFVIEIFSDFIAEILDFSGVVEGALDTLQSWTNFFLGVAVVINTVFSAIKSLGAFLGTFFGTLAGMFSDPKKFLDPSALKELFVNPYREFENQRKSDFESMFTRLFGGEEEQGTVAKNVHNNTFNNTFNIREKIEPDRIAFTMKDQLQKFSESRRKATGSPFLTSAI